MEAAKVYSGSSTVPAVVVIVVKYRACLSFGRLIIGRIGTIICLVDRRRTSAISIIIVGVAALSVY